MKVEVMTMEKKLYEGECISVYLKTLAGDAEILENHAEFVAIARGKVKLKQKDGKQSEIDIGQRRAIVHTRKNHLKIFII